MPYQWENLAKIFALHILSDVNKFINLAYERSKQKTCYYQKNGTSHYTFFLINLMKYVIVVNNGSSMLLFKPNDFGRKA